jgi:predicted  nucleic acid-binding Zn-ribbon protein
MTNTEYQQLVEFLGQQFTAVDRRFDTLERRFDGLEQRVGGLDQHVGGLDRRIGGLEQRIGGLEQRFDDFRLEVFARFDEVSRRLDRLEHEHIAITQALRRIEALLADERTRRELLEQGVDDLRRQVSTLQARLDDLEQRIRR